MPPELLSFIGKLPNVTYKLEWQGTKVDKKYRELKVRFPDFSHSTLIVLAILFQHLNLINFTNEEITAVSNLPLDILPIFNISNTSNKTLSPHSPLFDTASSRIFSIINSSEITERSKLQLLASYLDFNKANLKEIITKLYTGGF